MKKVIFIVLLALVFCISCSNGSSKIAENDDDGIRSDADGQENGDEEAGDDSDSDLPDSEMPDGSESGDEDEKDDSDIFEEPDEEIVEKELAFESGFIELEPVEYKLKQRDEKTVGAKIWYNFQPADEDPKEKPLFVFFNGGPGSASALIFLYNTSKMTGDQAFSGEGAALNENNWNQLGNLLYIDARQTGFSFGIADDPTDPDTRDKGFSTSNFNVFADAADFIRVILRFMERHPDIMANPVVISGESYGGTRSNAMLNVLINVADYAANNRTFYDEALFREIARHFKKVDPTLDAMPSPEMVLKQFGRQILIQPLVAGDTQMETAGELLERDDSPLYIVEQETGQPYTPCGNRHNCSKFNNALNYIEVAGRDIYSWRRPANWLFDYTDVATAKMLHVSMFEQFIMNDPRKIDSLYAANRAGAYRYGSNGNYLKKNSHIDFAELPETARKIMEYRLNYENNVKPLSSGDFESVFGDLPSYDEYYVDLNYTINAAFYRASVGPYDSINGDMFLENIRTVKTLITQAEEDIIIYAKGLPESLKYYSGVEKVELGEELFTVSFTDGSKAEVTWPFYPESSHSVSVNQPAMFLEDVKNWLK